MSLTNAYALIIGISGHRNISATPCGSEVDRVAGVVAGVLKDPLSCGYHPANVILLQQADATRARIIHELERLAWRSGPRSTVLIYFSGHGGRLAGDGSDDSYLMPIDGDWSSHDRLAQTAISSRLLADKLAAIRAHRVVTILDCCHTPGLAMARDTIRTPWSSGLSEDALGRLASGRGRVVIAATCGDDAAIGGVRHGLFAEHLIGGLRGDAGGSDGLIRVLDLHDHIQRNVVARCPEQRPVLRSESRDNFPIALYQRCASPLLEAPSPWRQFSYDVVVVHSQADRDRTWARSTLLRMLEDRGVRACAEPVDAEPGRLRLLELERLIATSRFTMPVLTPRFSPDRFEQLHGVMAQQLGMEEGAARLIPIVRESCAARLGLRLFVHLDMSRDEHVAPSIDRLVRTLRMRAIARSASS